MRKKQKPAPGQARVLRGEANPRRRFEDRPAPNGSAEQESKPGTGQPGRESGKRPTGRQLAGWER